MNFLKFDEPARFTQPVRQITYMLVVLGFVAIGSILAFGQIKSFFLANPYLNGVIAGVFLVGLLACFWQVSQIITSVIWMDAFIEDRPDFDTLRPPRLLAPIAEMLRYVGAGQRLSATSSRSMLDSVVSRMDESRDISRYLSNLLIFLGLLGTFYGLAITVPAVVETIRSLAPEESEGGVAVFGKLMDGLEKQLGGMGTAFSSSLLGLAGSLVVGLLDLFAGHGQNGFYRELEDWLSRNTSVGLIGSDAQSGGAEETDLSATAMSAEFAGLRELLIRSSKENSRMASSLEDLAKSFEGLVENLETRIAQERSSTEAMEKAEGQIARLAEAQATVASLLSKLAVDLTDAESRMHLKQIEVQLLRMYEDNLLARNELQQQISAEFNKLAETIREQSGSRPSGVAGRLETDRT